MASSQQIQHIKIEDIKLWTENPRDPIEKKATDEEVIDRALHQNPEKWELKKLAKEMGPHYDLSELPTVVQDGEKYIAYDGNRRLAVLKFVQNKDLYAKFGGGFFPELEPSELTNLKVIPCNLCDEPTALDNIERKHINNGSWGPLERDYFLHIHRGKEKSLFIKIEEQTGGMISNNSSLNKRFVKEEVLNEKNLAELGYLLNSQTGDIMSIHDDEKDFDIFDKIKQLIESKKIDTRKNRGKLKEPLYEAFGDIGLDSGQGDVGDNSKKLEIKPDYPKVSRLSPRSKERRISLFGGEKLSLRTGEVNNIVRDLGDMNEYYIKNRSNLSDTFPVFIRFGLRILVESASIKNGTGKGNLLDYINEHFNDAKGKLVQDEKDLLSKQNVSEKNLIELLEAGGHNYTASSGIDQTYAMSIIIREMIKITHSKEQK